MNVSPADTSPPRPRHFRGEQFTVTVGPMVHGAVCLARLDDGTSLMVDGAIPGETVAVALHHRKGSLWFADTAEVLAASPHRVAAPCPYVGTCGGCQLQHVSYPRQLALKREIVVDAMRRQHVVHGEIAVHGMDDPWRYRWRGEFHVVPGNDGLADAGLGFNRMRSWTAVAVDDCLIHHPRITDSLPGLRSLVRTVAATSLTALHLTVGEDGAELLLRPKPRDALDAAAIDGQALAENDRWSTTSTTMRWRGHSFRVSPESFIQVNWTQMDVLYGLALDGIGACDGATVVDAYAGIGVLACELALRGATVVCIESNRDSARLGVLNAQMNGCDAAVRYLAEPVEEVVARAGVGADAVLLDPPRAGCDPRVTAWLALAGPARIVYVSCDPATLARDLRMLTVSGPYTVDSVAVVDMFPQTHHVETVAVLSRSDHAAPPATGG
ncbi:MAG: class I SAM-dependent RNA methyltransferase [Candidatus Dormibacteraeota bacterium]|nr:class I SAM-dependent RNA methyltransferase [Candidatus Dormibacteraeota bacterium]